MRILCHLGQRCIHRVPRPRGPACVFVRRYTRSPLIQAEVTSTPLRKYLKDEKKEARTQVVQKNVVDAGVNDYSDWKLTVGIEIHAQLNTPNKLFSDAITYDDPLREGVHDFDLATPGSLPVFQKSVLIPALRAALALNCEIAAISQFDRKHYFYHDQPAGYQITQYYLPFATNGFVELSADEAGIDTRIGIKQVQLEQDTAKTQEYDTDIQQIDYSRSGFPLIEIISLPELHSAQAAAAYVRKVQALLLSVNAVTTGMELGGIRADVNVSVLRNGDKTGRSSYAGFTGLGQRTEIKNLGTIKGVEDAILAEQARQISVLQAGGTITGETRGWSLTRPHETRKLRDKEGEVDYRYMPDPDLQPLRIGEDLVKHIETTLPLTPVEKFKTLTSQEDYKLSQDDANIILSIDAGERLDYVDEVVSNLKLENHDSANDGLVVTNWVLQEIGNLVTRYEKPWTKEIVPASTLAKIIIENTSSRITLPSARKLLDLVFCGDKRDIEEIIIEHDLSFKPISDEEYQQLVETILARHSKEATQFRRGKHGVLGFLVGALVREAPAGQVEASKARGLLEKALSQE